MSFEAFNIRGTRALDLVKSGELRRLVNEITSGNYVIPQSVKEDIDVVNNILSSGEDFKEAFTGESSGDLGSYTVSAVDYDRVSYCVWKFIRAFRQILPANKSTERTQSLAADLCDLATFKPATIAFLFRLIDQYELNSDELDREIEGFQKFESAFAQALETPDEDEHRSLITKNELQMILEREGVPPLLRLKTEYQWKVRNSVINIFERLIQLVSNKYRFGVDKKFNVLLTIGSKKLQCLNAIESKDLDKAEETIGTILVDMRTRIGLDTNATEGEKEALRGVYAELMDVLLTNYITISSFIDNNVEA